MSDLIFVGLSTFAHPDRRPLDFLESSGIPFLVHKSGKRISADELRRDAGSASVVIAGVEPYDDTLFSSLHELRCISRCGVGVDAIDLAAARARGITVTNTPKIPAQAVAELAIAFFLALTRNLPAQTRLMNERRWERVTSHLFAGRSVGIIGFGRIGRRVAFLARLLGAKVAVCDPAINPACAAEAGVEILEMSELLATSDIVSLHASGGGVLISRNQLAAMKPGSILVNVARGGMVDEDALIASLESGHISGAGIDVFSKEPYSGRLCDFPQVMLTPHCATLPVEARAEMELESVRNAVDFLRGNLDPAKRVC
jgi:D-3-phosphoglycerate dehydrogenase